MSSDLALERAAWCLALDRDTARARAVAVAADVVCVASTTRGAGSVLIDDEGQTLFFPSNMTAQQALEAFRSGRRTPLEQLDGLRADLLRHPDPPPRPVPPADRAVIQGWSSLPSLTGMVFRGQGPDPTFATVGQSVMARSVVRAVRDPRVVLGAGPGIYCIVSDDGRSLDGDDALVPEPTPLTGLVAFRPGSRFGLAHVVPTPTTTAFLVLESGLDSTTSLESSAELRERFEADVLTLLGDLRSSDDPAVARALGLVGDIT